MQSKAIYLPRLAPLGTLRVYASGVYTYWEQGAGMVVARYRGVGRGGGEVDGGSVDSTEVFCKVLRLDEVSVGFLAERFGAVEFAAIQLQLYRALLPVDKHDGALERDGE